MRISKFKGYLCIALLVQAISSLAVAVESGVWSYNGLNGPDRWGQLDSDFEACSEGITQSPIDLTKKNLISNKEPISFDYKAYSLSQTRFGFKYYNRSKSMTVDGKTYDLSQFHFHMPAEHTVSGKRFPAEMHLVHHDRDGNLAVVAVLFKEGKSNKVFKEIVDTADKSDEEKYIIEAGDITSLLPENKEYFHYMGSLTTPPCTEGVNWYVLKHKVEVSKEDLSALNKAIIYNSRPIQDAAGRVAR